MSVKAQTEVKHAGNGNVSVLFDNRVDFAEPVLALTAAGRFEPLSGPEAAAAKGILLARHPQLKDLLDEETSAVFRVAFKSFQLLRGVREAHFISLQ